MKILICTFTFPPNKDGVSEASRVLAEDFILSGHDVTVATGHIPGRSLTHCGAIIKEFNIYGGSTWRSGYQGEVQEFQEFLCSNRFDALFFQCWDVWCTDIALPYFSAIPGIKVLASHGYSTHQWTPASKPPWGLVSWAFRLLRVLKMPWNLRRFDFVVFLSKRRDGGRFLDVTMAYLSGFLRFKVIPNSVDMTEFQKPAGAFRVRYGLQDRFMALCLANYSDRKNQKLTLEVFQDAAIPHSVLCFIGEKFNDYSAELQKSAALPGFDTLDGNVLFLDRLGREETCQAVVDCDVMLLTARMETQPIVLLEGMAAGKPFVAKDCGCITEYPGGLVCSNRVELVSALRSVAESRENREGLGRVGRGYVTVEHERGRVMVAYRAILDGVEKKQGKEL